MSKYDDDVTDSGVLIGTPLIDLIPGKIYKDIWDFLELNLVLLLFLFYLIKRMQNSLISLKDKRSK